MTFNGQILNKYADYKNHPTRNVILLDRKKGQIRLSNNDWQPLYDQSLIGDNIYKNEVFIYM